MFPAALSEIIVPGTDSDIVERYCRLSSRAESEVFGFEEEYCVLDVETTGYDPVRDRLIEVAGAIMRGPEVVDRFSTLVDPVVPIPLEITKLTGIDSEMTSGGPCPEIAARKLADFAAGRPVIAHNAAFDKGFLEAAAGGGAFGNRWIDSLTLVRIGMPRLRSHRLVDLAAAFAPDAASRAHRASDDVESLCRIWRVALCALSDIDPGVLYRIASLAPEAVWSEREVISWMSAAHSKRPYDLKEARRTRVAADRAEQLNDAGEMECECPEADRVKAQFADGGIAARMYEGFESRGEQVEMAGAVLDAFASGRHAAIEAGTGVGKSVAYLVPSVLFALRNRIGIGVATKTNALMDQLVYHELPRLASVLDEELRYVALKGYDHYLCLRKLERLASALDSAADADTIAAVAVLLSWTTQTSWGDLDSVNLHWDRELRSAVQSSHSDCLFKRCRYFPNLCYLHGVRRRASSSHVVVTNHALLFRDVVAQGGILPPIRHWVIDEAHAAESEARKQLSTGTSHSDLRAVLSSLSSRRGGILEVLSKQLRSKPDQAQTVISINLLAEEISRAATLTDSFFDFVKDLGPLASDSDYDAAELWVSDAIRETGPWGVVDSTGRSLAKRLHSIMGGARDLITALEQAGPDYSDAKADLTGLITRLAEQHAGLVAVVDGEDGGMVYSAVLDRRRNVGAERLTASRLDVGEVLSDDLYPRAASVVYTSATIATGDSFEHFARGVGLDRLHTGDWFSLRLASSYDFEQQMTVFTATDIAEPRESAAYLSGLEKLLEGVHVAMNGSVLTLFTNRRDMERLHAALEPRLRARGLDLIMQRRGTSAKRLRDEFIADRHLSLFALKSFWEGFDAKGDTLRCVVIPKLPFGRPDDPLSRERERREGRQAWSRYALPEAVIELKQAAGRLIRSKTDVGCLVIGDARVVSKQYGREFLRSLPVADVERLPVDEIVAAIRERFGDSE